MSEINLYTYFRSSAAYRVRIALNLKALDYQAHTVDLLNDGGEQLEPHYLKINPQGLVPTLVDGDTTLSQSLAIIEYLEETYPEPPLLPTHTSDRAYIRSLAGIVACDIHPLNNLRVLNYLKSTLIDGETSYLLWYRHWIQEGFQAIEELLGLHGSQGQFCWGDSPTLADVCVIPQVYNALRFECNLQPFPLIRSIYQHCSQIEGFAKAAPESQPDSPVFQSTAPRASGHLTNP